MNAFRLLLLCAAVCPPLLVRCAVTLPRPRHDLDKQAAVTRLHNKLNIHIVRFESARGRVPPPPPSPSLWGGQRAVQDVT